MVQGNHKRLHSLAEIETQPDLKKRATLPVEQDGIEGDIDKGHPIAPTPRKPDVQAYGRAPPEYLYVGLNEREQTADRSSTRIEPKTEADTDIKKRPRDIDVDKTIDSDTDYLGVGDTLRRPTIESSEAQRQRQPERERNRKTIRYRPHCGKAIWPPKQL
ncbi:MAG: hypothetical protein Q9188_001286 [Gyalolechia gomerana]